MLHTLPRKPAVMKVARFAVGMLVREGMREEYEF